MRADFDLGAIERDMELDDDAMIFLGVLNDTTPLRDWIMSSLVRCTFVAVIGMLLIATGLFWRQSAGRPDDEHRKRGDGDRAPGPLDVVLVGIQ